MTEAAYWKAKPDRADYDEMRLRLLEAAWQEASEHGYARLTLNSVAARANCSRSSVYRYFDSKEALLRAALHERLISFGGSLHNEIEALSDPADQLVRGVYRAAVAVKSSPAMELFRFISQDEGQSLAELTMDNLPALTEGLLSLDPFFENARQVGRVRPEVSDQDVMRWLAMQVLALSMMPDTGRDQKAEEAYIRKMLIPAVLTDA